MGAYIVYTLPVVGLYVTSKIFGKKLQNWDMCYIPPQIWNPS